MLPLPDFHNYLPVNDNAMRWGIYLTGVGRASTLPHSTHPYPRVRHPHLYQFAWEQGRVLPEFEILLISEGEGVFESETGQLPVHAGSLIFLFPGIWHRYRPLADVGWIERWIGFNGELAHRLVDLSLLQPDVPVSLVTSPATLAHRFDALAEQVRRDPAGNSILLSLLGLGLLGDLLKSAIGIKLPGELQFASRDLADPDSAVTLALEQIWTRGHQAISVAEIAAAAGLTQRTLERRFRQAVGHTVMEEIIRCRLNRAKRLLEETDMPMKTVALLAGFSSEQRMRIAFTQREHLAPLQFRRRLRGSNRGGNA